MTFNTVINIGLCLFMSGIIMFSYLNTGTYKTADQSSASDSGSENDPASENPSDLNDDYTLVLPKHRTVLLQGQLIPLLIVIIPCAIFFHGLKYGMNQVLSMLSLILTSLLIYEIILLITLPFFRKHFSPDVCASLWTLPDILYCLYSFSISGVPFIHTPILVIPISERLLNYIILIWIAGFTVSFLIKVMTHLIYRKKLLRGARPVEDPNVIHILENLIFEISDTENDDIFSAEVSRKKEPTVFPIYISPNTRTPLTIGISTRNTVIILPESTYKSYNSEDLRLILLHELGHIRANDCLAKFYMMFCNSFFWFLPIHRIAIKKYSEDMEIACDEAVLADADEHVRYQYANLLLRYPGDSRGFTSCLSATGKSIKNRMKKVLHPVKYNRMAGGLLLMALSFLLISTCGYIQFSPESNTASVFIEGHNTTVEEMRNANANNMFDYGTNWNDVADYLNNLQASRLLGISDMAGNFTTIIWCDYPEGSGYDYGTKKVYFADNLMKVCWEEEDTSLESILRSKIFGKDSYLGNNMVERCIYYHITDNKWKTLIPECRLAL